MYFIQAIKKIKLEDECLQAFVNKVADHFYSQTKIERKEKIKQKKKEDLRKESIASTEQEGYNLEDSKGFLYSGKSFKMSKSKTEFLNQSVQLNESENSDFLIFGNELFDKNANSVNYTQKVLSPQKDYRKQNGNSFYFI